MARDGDRRDLAATSMSVGGSVGSAGLLALVVITMYSFNSQVFVWIGTGGYASPLFQLWLCHSGVLVCLPYYVVSGAPRELLRDLDNSTGMDAVQLGRNAVIAAFFLMGSMYLWVRASMLIPTGLLAAIFQSSIAVVYVLSVLWLREGASNTKACGVFLAVAGVCISSFVGGSETMPLGTHGVHAYLGVLFAVGATLAQSAYLVWFKHTFGAQHPRFMLFFFVLVGLAHVFIILPLLAIGSLLGFKDAGIYLSAHGSRQWILIILEVAIANIVNVGSLTVIALRSPLFWSAFQMLSIPLCVLFDFVFSGIKPLPLSFIGYAMIFLGFLALTIPGSWMQESQVLRSSSHRLYGKPTPV